MAYLMPVARRSTCLECGRITNNGLEVWAGGEATTATYCQRHELEARRAAKVASILEHGPRDWRQTHESLEAIKGIAARRAHPANVV